MAKRRSRSPLMRAAETFAMSLLFEASNGTIGRAPKEPEGKEGVKRRKTSDMAFQDKRALLDSMTKLISLSHKVTPTEEEEDGIASFRSALDGSDSTTSGSGGDPFETTPRPARDPFDADNN